MRNGHINIERDLRPGCCVHCRFGHTFSGVTASPSVLESTRFGLAPLGLAGQLLPWDRAPPPPRAAPAALPPRLPGALVGNAPHSARTRRRNALSAICAAASSSLRDTSQGFTATNTT